jgi:hypothetical protein
VAPTVDEEVEEAWSVVDEAAGAVCAGWLVVD